MAMPYLHPRLSSSNSYKLNSHCNLLLLLPHNSPHLQTKSKFRFRIPYTGATSCSSGRPRIANPPFAYLSSTALLLVSEEGVSPTPTSGKEKDKLHDELSLPNIDKSGKFCRPRAARELALLTIYAACLQGTDPVRLFDKRLNAPREAGYEFDNKCLLEYNLMSFAGPPVSARTLQEASQLVRQFEAESATEAQVLSAPPKLVYSKLLLRFARKLLVAVVDQWDSHVLIINKVAPPNWKNQPTSRILELSILHLAMSEIRVLGTRHQIVINEAVDLAKRYCDGAASRIINGCLRTFVKGLVETNTNIQDRKSTP